MKGQKRLAGQRSARWAVMERFEVPDYDDPGRNYLTRWRIVQTPLFGLYLHRMDGPDPRPTLHDHPWSFVSVVLRGGYVENRLDPVAMDTTDKTVRRINVMPLRSAHYIDRLLRAPTWTFLFVGRRVKTWGYWEATGHGEWLWTEFDKHAYAAEFDAALRRRARVAK